MWSNTLFISKLVSLTFTKAIPNGKLHFLCIEEHYHEMGQLAQIQKQPSEVFCKKMCSWKFRKIHRKHLCQSFFSKKRLWHSFFPVNFAKFVKAHFLQNTYGRQPGSLDCQFYLLYFFCWTILNFHWQRNFQLSKDIVVKFFKRALCHFLKSC